MIRWAWERRVRGAGASTGDAMGDRHLYLKGLDFCHVMALIITVLGIVLIGFAALFPRVF